MNLIKYQVLQFHFGSIFSNIFNGNKASQNSEEELNNGRKKIKVEIGKSAEKISNNILQGTYGILIFNGFYSFIVSIICLMKNVKNNYIFYVPILINKFYYFTFAHQCTIYTDNDDEINYFTIATLLSIYSGIQYYLANREFITAKM